jgi:hypothetical protein
MPGTASHHNETRSEPDRRNGRGPRWLPRSWRTAAVATALLTLVALAAACSSGPKGHDSSSGGVTAQLLTYAKCMRAHGIPDFPDPAPMPNGREGFNFGGGGSDLNESDPRYKAANQACQALLPVPSAAQQRQFMAQALKFSQCMRSHGITDFPDPTANGGITITKNAGTGSDLDPNNPQFQAAQRACQHNLPAHPAGSNAGGAP